MASMHKIGTHKTSVFEDNGVTFVVYHSTAVVKFDGSVITLNTGGWQSVTTKARMNQASNEYCLGFSVRQKNHQWLISFGGVEVPYEGRQVLLDRRTKQILQ